jgi:hypothetical protein
MIFEVCCGLFWPLMGMQRSETIPEDIRSTVLHSSSHITRHTSHVTRHTSQVMNLFRLPLNIFVVVVLSKERHPSLVLMICAAALALASALQVCPFPLYLTFFLTFLPTSFVPPPPLPSAFFLFYEDRNPRSCPLG